jgi:hypothetical protein
LCNIFYFWVCCNNLPQVEQLLSTRNLSSSTRKPRLPGIRHRVPGIRRRVPESHFKYLESVTSTWNHRRVLGRVRLKDLLKYSAWIVVGSIVQNSRLVLVAHVINLLISFTWPCRSHVILACLLLIASLSDWSHPSELISDMASFACGQVRRETANEPELSSTCTCLLAATSSSIPRRRFRARRCRYWLKVETHTALGPPSKQSPSCGTCCPSKQPDLAAGLHIW